MAIRKPTTGPQSRRPRSKPETSGPAGDGTDAATAFDAFVERGLHELYDQVLAEPIPEELLKLIDADRRK